MANTECCGSNAFTCPTVCQLIDSNSAATVSNCIQNAPGTKEDDIKALICDVITPDLFTLDELNILAGHLTGVQLNGLQSRLNLPTGDTISLFTGDDGGTQFHCLEDDGFTLTSDNKHGNRARYTSIFRIVPSIPAGRHYLDPNPANHGQGNLVEADGVTPVPNTATIALAQAAFGVMFDDWYQGISVSISDLTSRPLSGGSGWAFASLIKIENGLSGWRVPNRNAMNNFSNADLVLSTGGMSWLPMNKGGVNIWTNTRSRANTYNYYGGLDALITNFFGFTTSPLPGIYIRSNAND